MEIRKASKEELKDLVSLYKKAFEIHGIFQKPEDEVLKYLENADGEFIVAVEDGKIVGGLLIVTRETYKGHKIIRFKHVAVAEEYRHKGVGSALIKKAEEIAGKGKIELHVVEGDKVEFYKKNGYEIEGELKSHYRPGETCFVLGKVIG